MMRGNVRESINAAILGQVTFAAVIVLLLLVLQEALLTTITITSLVLLIVRFSLLQRHSTRVFELARARTKNLGSALFVLLILIQAGQLGVLNVMVNLLVSGAVLWWFTLPSHKLPSDRRNVNLDKHLAPRYVSACQNLFLCLLFLIAVAFIYRQSLADSILHFTMVGLNVLGLLFISSPQLALKAQLKVSTYPLLYAAPIAALMFVVFPNLPPFWKLPEQQQAKTGLSDAMTPGDISDLAQSNRLAFRAEFESGTIPEMANLYWRVFTMEQFDGETWSMAPRRKNQAVATPSDLAATGLEYSLVLEPTEQNWLVSYQNSQTNEPLVEQRGDYTLWRRKAISQKTRYEAKQYQNQFAPELLPWEHTVNSEVAQPSDRLGALVTELTQGFSPQSEPQRVSQAILDYFRDNQFQYTLTPERLSGHHMEDFLLQKRQGFCAHFAGAYALLMRKAGIPTRVVTGYHGGEFNLQGNYFQVYDAQAHAWAEYWHVNQAGMGQWHQVDPTSVVSPQRLTQGRNPLALESQNLIEQPFNYVKSIRWLNQVRQYLQSLDYYWTVWILDFDQQQRLALFHRLKEVEVNWSRLLLKLILVMAGLAVIYLGVTKLSYYRSHSLEQRALVTLQKRCKKLLLSEAETRSHNILGSETIAEYIARMSGYLPNKVVELRLIQTELERLMYAEMSISAQKKGRQRLMKALNDLSKS